MSTLIQDALPREQGRAIPPFQAGDHLTRDEFERRYRAMPYVHRAELIEGVVYMPSPVSASEHGGQARLVDGYITGAPEHTEFVRKRGN